MAGQYHINMEQYSLEHFRQQIETQELLPGRRILKEDIGERFAVLESAGIGNLKELIDALKTKEKISGFSKTSGLPVDYLTILVRQAKSLVPNPFYLKDVPGVDLAYVNHLGTIGINNAKQLFEKSITPADRRTLCEQADIPEKQLLELVRMADIARAGYIGPVFARLLYESGIGSLDVLAKASPDQLYQKLLETNGQLKLTRASFTVKDVASCIEAAKKLPEVIEY